jgi:hypothetical protein
MVGNSGIVEIAPSGVEGNFVGGFSPSTGVAFNSTGNLFVTIDSGPLPPNNIGNIVEITPGVAASIFATETNEGPAGLAFNSAGNLFVANHFNGTITEITPGGAQSTFASGLTDPTFLAFEPVPEPSTLGFLAVGATALLIRRR